MHISDNASVEFKIKNIGQNNIIIDRVNTDCHCTSIETHKNAIIKPDSIYNLRVRYDKSSIGFFEQKVTVFYKNWEHPSLLLFRGHILRWKLFPFIMLIIDASF